MFGCFLREENRVAAFDDGISILVKCLISRLASEFCVEHRRDPNKMGVISRFFDHEILPVLYFVS